jgi:hypothetical protein
VLVGAEQPVIPMVEVQEVIDIVNEELIFIDVLHRLVLILLVNRSEKFIDEHYYLRPLLNLQERLHRC